METQTELHITLATLTEIGACDAARRQFVEVFGEDGNPTAREVFAKLAESERHDWLFWLNYHLQGFAQAVGTFSVGNYHCLLGGRLEIEVGFVLADGNASVLADGNASVEADGNASVEAYGNATLFLFRYADMTVKFTLKSIFACVIDRRGDGIPKLVTVTQAELDAAEAEAQTE